MTLASDYVSTPPFCGACGWDVSRSNIGDAGKCDACGAELTAYGFDRLAAPAITATAGSLQVTLSWTAVDGADATEVSYTIDGGTAVVTNPATSPIVVVAAEGEVVAGKARSIENGVAGAWSAVDSAASTA